MPPADGTQAAQEIHGAQVVALLFAELYGQVMAAKYLDATDAAISTVLNVAMFFFCYKVLSGAGVDDFSDLRARHAGNVKAKSLMRNFGSD